MKGNNGEGNIPERDVWETPQKLWDQLNEQYNFTFDCCASANNNKCERYTECFTIMSKIPFVCWMNPPFSKAYAMFEHFFKEVYEGVAIFRCDNMETKLWQEIILKNASWVFIPKGRICYEGMKGKGSRFPSALIGFNVDKPKELEGFCLYVKN